MIGGYYIQHIKLLNVGIITFSISKRAMDE